MTTYPAITIDTAAAARDLAPVRAGFTAVGAGDLPAFAAAFHPDASWNHRNDDRFGGIKTGIGEITGFLAESMELTAGTLRAVPDLVMPDGAGHVSVLTTVSATRPDGRRFEDAQVMLFVVRDGLIRSVDQFVGDPAAVTAFWA